ALDAIPEWVSHEMGRGRVATLCGDLFGAYHQVPAPVLSAMIQRVLRQLHPAPVAELGPSGPVEVSVRERGGDWLVHLVNRGADGALFDHNFFVGRVP